MEAHDVNWVDYGILALIGISVLMGILRGFVREAMSLVTWLMAIFLGAKFCEPVSEWFTQISMIGLRYLISFILIVLSVLILGGITSYLTLRLIKFTGFGVTDRIIGFVFGLGRGVAVIAFIVMVFLPTPVSKDPLWQESTLIPRFTPTSIWIKEQIPEDWINWFKKIQLN